MKNININIEKASDFIDKNDIQTLEKELIYNADKLKNRSCKGSDFLGWYDLPSSFEKELIEDIIKTANNIRKKCKFFVIIGIGGSYLGARAVIEALNNPFESYENTENPKILYAGHNLSEDYYYNLLKLLDKNDYAMAVISKSGTTTEPAIAFRILRQHLEIKYGKEEASSRIIAITDKHKGALKALATKNNYKTYTISDNIGGRFSVLTPCGLLPIAVAGYDIKQLIDGAAKMEQECKSSVENSIAAKYAVIRNLLLKNGFKNEILINFSPSLMFFTEWWKQLFGESEGKEHKGIFPSGANFTTDLHSMGQYIQDGPRELFETLISVKNAHHSIVIPKDEQNLDELNYISDSHIEYINKMAELGTSIAHVDGGVPNIKIEIDEINEYNLGQLIYFFQLACAYSGLILGVNPFDQPGVEAYKNNMFALLAKPSYENQTIDIRKKI